MEVVSRVSRFCEAVHQQGIAQPIDAWSCLIFVLAGAAIVLHGNRSGRYIFNKPIYSFLFAFSIALVGPTSFWNHATLSYWGGTTDVASMYLFASYATLLLLATRLPISPRALIGILVAVNIPLSLIAGIEGPITDYVFGVLVGLLIVTALLSSRRETLPSFRFFALAMALFFVGFVVWSIDIRGIWCNPTSLIQGHAIWHVLTAAAAWFLYRFLLTKTAAARGEL